MALFKSQVITQASGSVGGLTYSHALGGMYMRARSIPVNPNTAFQQQVKAGLTTAVTRWTEVLTQAQRNGWNLYGANTPTTNALGDPILLSGQNWYIAVTTTIAQAAAKFGATPIFQNDAPTIFDRGDFTTPVASAAAATGFSIAFTNTDEWANEAGSVLGIFEGKPRNATRQFFNGPYRLVELIIGAAVPPVSPVTVTLAELASRGFAIAAGQAVTMSYGVLRGDGRLSTRRQQTVIVA